MKTTPLLASLAAFLITSTAAVIAAENTTHRATDATSDTAHRASTIIGMTVKNNDNKVLGEVNDIVLDMRSGQIKYLALSYGGVLGVGDKLFAVPFNAFECRQGDGEDEYYLAVNVSEEALRNAPGFNQDKWPNLADPRWGDEIDRHYRTTDRRTQRGTVDSNKRD